MARQEQTKLLGNLALLVVEYFARLGVRGILLLVGFTSAVLWAFWPTFQDMSERWANEPQYSHGFLVPFFALVLLWSRRELFPQDEWQSSWWGVAFLLLGGTMRFVSAYFFWPLDGLALLPTLAGIGLLVGGWPVLRWSWLAILFLGFMVPLPFRVGMALASPLRQIATLASTYLLQTFGFPAISEGNIILIHDLELGVIDACSGLGMLFTFLALATAVALVLSRPLFDRLAVVLSAIPIALLVNIIRITLTSMAFVWFGEGVGKTLTHDLAGWIMMPMALGFVWLELWLFGKLFQDMTTDTPPVFALGHGSGTNSYPTKNGQPFLLAPPEKQDTAQGTKKQNFIKEVRS